MKVLSLRKQLKLEVGKLVIEENYIFMQVQLKFPKNIKIIKN